MNITVQVDEVTLATVVRGGPAEYGDPVTVADLVAGQIVQKLAADRDEWDNIARRVRNVRDEEIRAAVLPMITEALTKPFRQMTYGEETGPETTLSQLIVAEARKQLGERADPYNHERGTVLSKTVAAEVKKAFTEEIADAVKQARDLVSTELGDEIGKQVTAAVRAGLAKR